MSVAAVADARIQQTSQRHGASRLRNCQASCLAVRSMSRAVLTVAGVHTGGGQCLAADLLAIRLKSRPTAGGRLAVAWQRRGGRNAV